MFHGANGRCRRSGVLVFVAGLVMTTLSAIVATAPAASAAPGAISTVAGGGIGDGYPASRAFMGRPVSLGVDGAGNIFVADEQLSVVRKVATDGVITTVAGIAGVSGFAGDGGPATKALLDSPSAVAVDGAGRLYIADQVADRVRRVDTNGIITTIAGNGSTDFGPDGGLATAGGMYPPTALTFDPAGNLLVGAYDRVLRIDASGHRTTIAGGGSPADGLGDGGPATAAALSGIQGLGYGPDGTLFISDQNNQRIRKVSPGGIMTTAAGDGNYNDSGDGGPAVEAEIAQPVGLAVDSLGNVSFAEGSFRIRRISPTGIITTFAGTGDFAVDDHGDGGPATSAHVDTPAGLAVDASRTVFFTQASYNKSHSRVRKVTTDGVISAVAGGGFGDGDPATAAFLGIGGFNPQGGLRWQGGSYYLATPLVGRVRRVGPDGVISTVAGGGSPDDGLGDGGPATAASLDPQGVAPTNGDLFIADCGNNRVRRVDPAGNISTVAGGGSPADGLGDGGPATAAQLDCPTGLLVVPAGTPVPAGTMYVTACNAFSHGDDPANARVRKIDPSGTITTVAGTGVAGFNGDGLAATATQFDCPSDVALDPAGNLLVADSNNNRIRRIEGTTGLVSTVAGDGTNGYGKDGVAATSTPVNNPTGLAFDAGGRMIVAESSHARVRVVNTAGIISTVAGTGVPGLSGDGGPATQATLYGPSKVTVDGSGNILVADSINNRVRQMDAGTPVVPAAGECGGVVTQNLTLTHDVGPCPAGVDGMVVGADNVTVNLNGHSIVGPGPGMDTGANAGIRLTQRSGVTVTGGRVTGFDAGVALIGSSSNTVSKLQVVKNVAPLVTPNGFEGSEFGDGIVLMYSGSNKIDANTVDSNGVFDGIGLLGLGTNDNQITNNIVSNVVGDGRRGTPGIGIGIDISPFLDLTLPGRGNSLHGNNVIGNEVRNNFTNGISMQSNIGATVAHNVVHDNGLKNPFPGNGIGVVHNARAEANLNDVIQFNDVHGNAGDGLNLIGDHNQINNNTVKDNARLKPDSFDIHELDFDPTTFEPSCLANVWSNNHWGKAGINPPCIAGSAPSHGPHASGHAATAPDTSASTDPGSPRHLSTSDANLGHKLTGQ